VWGRAGCKKKFEKLIFKKGLNRTLYSLLVQCAGRGGRGGVPKPRRGPGWDGRGEVPKPRGGHQKDAGDQVVEKPRGGPGRGRRGVRSPRGGWRPSRNGVGDNY
jgi:hypothetical protein